MGRHLGKLSLDGSLFPQVMSYSSWTIQMRKEPSWYCSPYSAKAYQFGERCYGLNYVPISHPSNLHVEFLAPSTLKCDLIWKEGHYKHNYLEWGYTGVGWTPTPICPLSLQKGETWTQTCTQGEQYVKMKAETAVMQQKPRNIRDYQQTIRGSRRGWE